MELDIRKNVLNNLKQENKTTLEEVINTACSSKDDLILPGLGVILELVWFDLTNNSKENIIDIAIKKMNH